MILRHVIKPNHHSEAVKSDLIERVLFFLFVRYLPLVLLGAMYPTRNIFWGFPSCRLLITLHIGVNGAHWLPVGLFFQPFVYYEIRLGGLDVFC